MGYVPVFPLPQRRPSFTQVFKEALGQSLGVLPANIVGQGIELGGRYLSDYLRNEMNRGNLAEATLLATKQEDLARAHEEAKRLQEMMGLARVLSKAQGKEAHVETDAFNRTYTEPEQELPERKPTSILDELHRALSLFQQSVKPPTVQSQQPTQPPSAPSQGAPGEQQGQPTAPSEEANVPKAVKQYRAAAQYTVRGLTGDTEPEGLSAARRAMLEAAEATGKEWKRTVGFQDILRNEAEKVHSARRTMLIEMAANAARAANQPAKWLVSGDWIEFASDEEKKGREVNPRDLNDVMRFMDWKIAKVRSDKPSDISVTIAAIEAAGPYITGLMDLRKKVAEGIVPETEIAQRLVSQLDNNARQMATSLTHTIVTNYGEDKRNAAQIGAMRRQHLYMQALQLLPEVNRGIAIVENQLGKDPDNEQLAYVLQRMVLARNALARLVGMNADEAAGLYKPPTPGDIESAAKWAPMTPEQAELFERPGAMWGPFEPTASSLATSRAFNALQNELLKASGQADGQLPGEGFDYATIIKTLNLIAPNDPDIVLDFVTNLLNYHNIPPHLRHSLEALRNVLSKGR